MARRKKGLDISGWLVIDKPRDMGSTDVVSIMRRMFNANKNGHCGTLDPFATGVLPIAFGEATKLVPFVTDGRKVYEFVLQFGASSSTGDSEGEIEILRDARRVSEEEILAVMLLFLGKIEQTPPQYSAIKINGERAYKLAREGVSVEMPSRIVEIYSLKLIEMLDNNQAKFEVECSKGTYVRTLGRDIALKLSTKGYLKELRRTKCGKFGLEDAIGLEELKKMEYEGSLDERLLSIRACLRDIAVIAVSKEDAAKLKLGQSISPKAYSALEGDAVAVLGEELVAIVKADERKISPVRVFNL